MKTVIGTIDLPAGPVKHGILKFFVRAALHGTSYDVKLETVSLRPRPTCSSRVGYILREVKVFEATFMQIRYINEPTSGTTEI